MWERLLFEHIIKKRIYRQRKEGGKKKKERESQIER